MHNFKRIISQPKIGSQCDAVIDKACNVIYLIVFAWHTRHDYVRRNYIAIAKHCRKLAIRTYQLGKVRQMLVLDKT